MTHPVIALRKLSSIQKIHGFKKHSQKIDRFHETHTNSATAGSDFLRTESEFNVRLCFVDFDGTVAMDLLKSNPSDYKKVDNEFVEKVAPRVVEGIRRLKRFVQNYS